MNENVSDADLERFLRRRERISSEYAALGSEQPAPELDALVLERARAALGEEAGHASWRRRRWPAITALAATVVLSFAVIVRIVLQNGDPSLISTTIPSATIPTPTPAEPAAPAAADNAEAVTEGFAAPPAALSERARADVPAAPQFEVDLPRAAIEAQIREATERAPLASSPAAAAKTRIAPSGRASESAQSPQAAGASEDARASEDRTYGALRREHAAASKPMDRAAQVSDVAAAAPREAAPADEAKAERLRDPRAWLEEIERLRAAGQEEEAAREMKRFLETYPDYPLSGEAETVRPASRTPTK